MTRTVDLSIDRFRLTARLGGGGLGDLYRGFDEGTGREVVVLVLPEIGDDDEPAARRFEEKVLAAQDLKHPCTVEILDFGIDDDRPFIVADPPRGTSVEDAIDSGVLTNRKVIEFGSRVSEALATAHERGLIHGALEPWTLFLAENGAPKILGLGLGVEGSGTGRTGAPEQLRGDAVDHRADVFSLGVVLYEMLTGLSPFRRLSPADSVAAVLSEDPPPVSETTSRVTPAFDGVIRRCLAKRPEDRFQSAGELGRALEALVASPAPRPQSRRLSRSTLLALAGIPMVVFSVVAFHLLQLAYRALLEREGVGRGEVVAASETAVPFDVVSPEATGVGDHADPGGDPDRTPPPELRAAINRVIGHWSVGGHLATARTTLESLPDGDHPWLTWTWLWQELFERRFDAALRRVNESEGDWLETDFVRRPKPFLRAMVLGLSGRDDSTAAEWRSAGRMIEEAMGGDPADPRLHASNGVVLAALGEADLALAEGRRAMELAPDSGRAGVVLSAELDMARILTVLGQEERAIERLERLLDASNRITVPRIEIDPSWDPLRDHPRYQRLLGSHPSGHRSE
jgi:hypothetical protein